MVISPFLFWSLVFFGSVGFVSLTLAFLFNGRGLASKMYDEIEEFFDDVQDKLAGIFDLAVVIIILPFAFLISLLIPKSIKKDILVVGRRDSIIKIIVSKRIIKNLSNDEILNLQDQLDGHVLYKKIREKDPELMGKIINNAEYWERVSRNCSFDVAQQFPTLINWSVFLRVRKLSEGQLSSLSHYIDWDYVAKYQSFSEDFFFENSNRLKIGYIDTNRNPWLREANQSDRVKLYINSL